MESNLVTLDGNEAASSVAFRTSEVIAIYPITPASPMGELADEWAVQGKTNIWGNVPEVIELQSEAGAAGACHGSVQAGALTTTFTASQGLLLMLPNMYKIAGELSAFCLHVSARTVATHALSIFGDHSDVMAARATGFALLASGSPQEVHDLAIIAHAATLESRVPFLHYFDGFRTSHEVSKMKRLSDEDLGALIPEELVAQHRCRAMTPDRPILRGTAQNPDTFFQAREACNRYYDACPGVVRSVMDRFASRVGRTYRLFDYVGHPQAERVVVLMGSGAEAAHDAVEWLVQKGERVGLVKVRLYRPFSVDDFVRALPPTVRAIGVLDRTKEPGAIGEPLYLDVVTALREGWSRAGRDAREPTVIGGRYGLSSKEFTPAMVKAVLDELDEEQPKRHFTVGIVDDVTNLSLPYDEALDIEPDEVVRAVFYGLGADGTVGANKNSVKIIGEGTEKWAQGYFVYDSKKAGAVTVSHLRFGPQPIRATYLVRHADFVACHHFGFLERQDVLECAVPGATFLLNSPHGADEVWSRLPREVQEQIIEKRLRFHAIDAAAVAREAGMGRRINTIMQTCFFALAGVLPREEAIERIKEAIQKTYESKGAEVVRRNFAAVDAALAHLQEVKVPGEVTAQTGRPPAVSPEAPEFVQQVTARMIEGKGDDLPVSAFPVDGTWPVATAQWEKRNIALEIPVWDPDICIQCNKCALVCPHAAVRVKVFEAKLAAAAPESFKWMTYKGREFKGLEYTVQVAPEDCTGCTLCVKVCPAKDKKNPRHKSLDMVPLKKALRDSERECYAFFLDLPEPDRAGLKLDVKRTQFFQPLFEYSGACAGCGETPYIKLMSQLFGDRALIGNATGCSSIYCGNLPTTPFTTNPEGRGPTWSNSLFEDNAEFGVGMRLAVDELSGFSRRLVRELTPQIGDDLAGRLLDADQSDEAGVAAQREAVRLLKEKLKSIESVEARRLDEIVDYLVRKSVWIVGGDGWAYDIGFGGLDHVLSMGRDVNILVLDTEVYSNTGGQASKATPLGAAAKFAAAGKEVPKKDLGLMAMAYGSVYVAKVAFGAKDAQTVKAFVEAESYPGTSLIIAYSHCIAHGYDMARGLDQQSLAVKTGYWPLYRFDPRRTADGESPLQLDSGPPRGSLSDFVAAEARFRMVERYDPERYRRLIQNATQDNASRYELYQRLAASSTEERGTGEG